MIAIRKYPAAAPPGSLAERCVDVPRCRNLEALHSASERHPVLGLHKQVDMVSLQADMNDPDVLAKRRGDRGTAHRLVQRAAPETADLRHDTHHDVQRLIRLEVGPPAVPLPGARTARFSPGAAPLATTPKQRLLDVLLAPSPALRCHAHTIATHHDLSID